MPTLSERRVFKHLSITYDKLEKFSFLPKLFGIEYDVYMTYIEIY